MSQLAQQPAEALPRWNTSNIYSSLTGADYAEGFHQFQDALDALERYFDEHGIRRLPAGHAAADDAAATVREVLIRSNDLARLAGTLRSFVVAFYSTDSYDATAAREMSKLDLLDVRKQKLDVRLQGWIGSLAERLDALTAQDPVLRAHEFFLRDAARRSRYLMSEELEALAAELCVDAGVAFGKLQGAVTSQLKATLETHGGAEELPIMAVRNFLFDADPDLRKRAYEAELKAWSSVRTSVAACMNGVKGNAITLARRRGRAAVLDEALEENRIDRATLDALLGAIREAFPVFRRYLRAKARRLGLDTLRWWDLFAPLGSGQRTFSWDAARQFIVEKFGAFDAELGQFAAQAFDGQWIDAGPRDGKRGGAFCMEVLGTEESRILANFDGSFEQVMTLAHELGHGYHNHCQKGLEPLRRGAPSTLAETASIFCETLVAESALAESPVDEQLTLLELQLAGATQVCLDISARFLFESAVFERRASRELSADELCQLMGDAQRETYADAVAPSTYHPYMWLWKPHYYSHDHNFYNFPYAFGHLFGLGLYAVYQREGNAFIPRYNELLRSTGQAEAAPLARRFGIDITRPAFWQGSLRVIEKQVERFEDLA